MSEAPKRMWVHEGFWTSGDASYWVRDEQESEEEIPYIRADLVDELVEALKMGTYEPYCECEECKEVRAAIAKLEESHEV